MNVQPSEQQQQQQNCEEKNNCNKIPNALQIAVANAQIYKLMQYTFTRITYTTYYTHTGDVCSDLGLW